MLKVSRPNLNSLLKRTPIFEWCVVRCESKKTRVKNRLGFAVKICYCSHSRLNNQHKWGDLYDHLMIFTLMMIKVFHMSSKNYEESGYGHDMYLLIILH